MLRSTVAALCLFGAPMAHASDVPPSMLRYIYADLMLWINDVKIVDAILTQNQKTERLSDAQIVAWDADWRNALTDQSAPMVQGLVETPVSDFLRAHQEQSEGRITEVVVLDQAGLSVAASHPPSELWHGDAPEFRNTFPMGSGAIFIDDIRLDDDTNAEQGQVSFAVTDPETGDVIGAISVGLQPGAFF